MWLARAGVALLAGIGAIQFIPVAQTNPPATAQVPAPTEVQALMRRACYDCHSNETRWPWYARIAPVSWALTRDVEEGRRELNFSTWDQYDDRRKARKLKETVEQLEKDAMPPWYYIPLHPEAKLSEAERELIIKWAKQS